MVPDIGAFAAPPDCDRGISPRGATAPSNPDLTIHIRNVAGVLVPYTLTKDDYIIRDEAAGACVSGITGGGADTPGVARGSTMVLGDVFMRKFSPTFNFERGENAGQIALAPANRAAIDRTRG